MNKNYINQLVSKITRHKKNIDFKKMISKAKFLQEVDPTASVIESGWIAERIVLKTIEHLNNSNNLIVADSTRIKLDHPTLGVLVQVLRETDEMPRTLSIHLEALVMCRNRAVHGVGQDDITISTSLQVIGILEEMFIWSKSIGVLYDFENKTVGSFLTESTLNIDVKETCESVSNSSDRESVEAPTEVLSRKNTIVDDLKNILRDYLSEEGKKYLLARLREEGAEGDDDGILCEYCLNANPIEILCENFGIAELDKIAKKRSIPMQKRFSQDEIAKALLIDLNFRIVDEAKGLTHVKQHLSQLQAKINHAHDRDSIVGFVNPISTEMERLLDGLITFYANIFWGSNYKKIFSEWHHDFGKDRLTLGSKCNLLSKMEKEILRNEVKSIKLKELFHQRGHLIGKKELNIFSNIVPDRGDFSHFKKKTDRLSISECRDKVLNILYKSNKFIEHLSSQNIYPQIVTVLEYVEDRYGRKYIMCIDENGKTEKVYTQEKIDPMKHYFLYPLTNPVRIYPLLIEYVLPE